MQAILQSSENISKIINSIDEIAFQTNILALNAAVEAAHAGESGAGFAVVAEEVRNLAQRSTQAAADTKSLVEQAVARSTEGSKISERVENDLEAIVSAVREVDQEIAQISVACNEQSQGIAQVSGGLDQLESMTKDNSDLANRTTEGATELTSHTDSLSEISVSLNTLTRGSRAERSKPVEEPEA